MRTKRRVRRKGRNPPPPPPNKCNTGQIHHQPTAVTSERVDSLADARAKKKKPGRMENTLTVCTELPLSNQGGDQM